MKPLLALVLLLASAGAAAPQQPKPAAPKVDVGALAIKILTQADMLCYLSGPALGQPAPQSFICIDKMGNRYAVYIRTDQT